VRVPEVRYAKTASGVHIAYQVVGDGPIDLVFVPGYAANLQWQWELPSYARFLERLASFSRLIIVDRRGAGLSDRFSPEDLPPLEDLADDLEVVLDAVGSERAALFGAEDGGMICCMFAARRPERTESLVVYGMAARSHDERRNAAGFWQQLMERVDASWGTPEYARWDLSWSNPSRVDDELLVGWMTVAQRLAASPGTAKAFLELYGNTDVRGLLPAISAPTLVLHRIGDRLSPMENALTASSLVPGAKLAQLEGDDHYWVVGNDDILDEVEEFLTGSRGRVPSDRVLASVLFTDIVGSTDRAAALGDTAWKELLASHDRLLRAELQRFDGLERGTAGDGFFATFDGPARAVRCAWAIEAALQPLQLEIRAGVHTGEVEIDGGDVRGIAVHIGARVAALAGPSEILVSSTVKELVAGSGLVFEDAGEHELKGVPDRWRLYRVIS
jgi:class 3 adenylate cyclase/alpha-beta hydrolase superfamily lysophospholipase